MKLSNGSHRTEHGPAGEPRRIVVVDDAPDFLALVAVLLEMENYKVFMRSIGRNALPFVKKHRPHVVILDLMLPDVDGLEILRDLKNDSSTCLIPVIVCTAAADRVRAQRRYLDQMGVKVLEKPFELDALLATIRLAMGITA